MGREGEAVPEVWIGAPQRGRTQENVQDPYTSKIGGQAVYFRTGSGSTDNTVADSLSRHFCCPQCKSTAHVSLLSQIYAPLATYDRVLYILTCSACTRRTGAVAGGGGSAAFGGIPAPHLPASAKKNCLATRSATSFCFALRSQNFSREFFKQLRVEAAPTSTPPTYDGPLFEGGDDDWGEGADDWGKEEVSSITATASPALDVSAPAAQAAASNESQNPVAEEMAYPLAVPGSIVPLKGPTYTGGIPLDLYIEPAKKKEREQSIEEQLALAERMYGDGAAVDTSDLEEDNETPAEACVGEYMEVMERDQSQCVRWCPGGAPLRASLSAIGVNGAAVPPACPSCGAARQFEVQLTAPCVYFLTKEMDETANANVHFSNVLVYTCSRHCYAASKNLPYLPEYVVVEDEL